MTVLVKICGINDGVAMDAAVAARADFLGFVFFPKSPRHVTPARAAELLDHAGTPLGCAPSPRPTETLREALASLGIEYREMFGTLTRRYAVVTHYPFKGGCEICHLQAQCPKGQGQAEAPSILLPGHESGSDEN